MSTVHYTTINGGGDVHRVLAVHPDNASQGGVEAILDIGELLAHRANIPDLAPGELIEGRTSIGARVWGVVYANHLADDVTYQVRGFPINPNDWNVRLYDVDARQLITRVRLIARVVTPVTCGLDQSILPIDRTYFVVEADGQTPATSEVLALPLALHAPCEHGHSLEVSSTREIVFDVHNTPWPATPQNQARFIARIVPFGPEAVA